MRKPSMGTSKLMSTFVIGDIQGCFDELQKLLEVCKFNHRNDCLWLAGDLINRGPKNLETMKFILDQKNCVVVLGNHDLHFLAVAKDAHTSAETDTFQDILDSEEREDIVEFLRYQKLLHYDAEKKCAMVHASLPPIWHLGEALTYAQEVETVLSGPGLFGFLEEMYGDKPSKWERTLEGNDRLRVITNYFTRLRYCNIDGTMELEHKSIVQPKGFSPWFEFSAQRDIKILFGHWASLNGITKRKDIIALDTGCVWGRSLTAMRLEDCKLFSTPALQRYQT